MLELAFNIGLWSHHFDGGDYNERHDLIGVEVGQYGFAVYENSHFETSYIVTKRYNLGCLEAICVDAVPGLATGYKWGITPIAALQSRIKLVDDVELAVSIAPGYNATEERAVLVFGAGFRVAF